MDETDYLNAIILGMVEGITEFLPISSTGHLIIAGNLLEFTGMRAATFEIFIQLGAILAVLWNYRQRLIFTHLESVDRNYANFLINLGIAFLPAVLLGLMSHRIIKNYLFSPMTVAVALFIGGLIILWVEMRNYVIRYEHAEEISWREALLIGFAQCFALFPGVSRAAATIIGGQIWGLSRRAATEFSFFLAIPTMFAATFYDLYKSWAFLDSADIPLFALGFITAFFSALVVVRALLLYVGRSNFIALAWYRIFFGGIVLWYGWTFPGSFSE